eukprot:TRINITY_DN9253_c0_g5_i1.p1 TRINITY_DN9253_c0_g5~~TRINITY_DN9253_c0_g5_i1.p1  ORF type:complete len:549 (+),score=89.20 TRINITY_DN9253_c0_g5_i1:118-1764(+)
MADASGASSISRQVLREELQEFAETFLRTALDRTRQELVAAVAEGVLRGSCQPKGELPQRDLKDIPPMHSWMRRKPTRYHDKDEEESAQMKPVVFTESQPPRKGHSTALDALVGMPCPSTPRSTGMTYSDELHKANASTDEEGNYPPLLPSVFSRSNASFLRRTGATVGRAVRSETFEHMAALVVLVNAVMVGLETSLLNPHMHRHGTYDGFLHSLVHAETAFCVFFALELSLRIFTYGREFFFGESWKMNAFDTCIVVLQVVEQVSHSAHGRLLFFSSIKFVRLLRLLRIVRLLRVLNLVEELQQIIISLVGSLSSLAWVLMLLAVLVYFFSVLFTQMALVNISPDDPDFERIIHFFGSIPRTALTLFASAFGGLGWHDQVELLQGSISSCAGWLFCLYIAFCMIALMNVITGVFVDKALRSARAAEEKSLCNHVTSIFFDEGYPNKQISWDMFHSTLSETGMADYFKAIDVDESEAKNLFTLLDTDNSGGVDCKELVNGLLRLRGNAGALEVSLMMRELSYMLDRFDLRLQEGLRKQRAVDELYSV